MTRELIIDVSDVVVETTLENKGYQDNNLTKNVIFHCILSLFLQ